MPPARRGAQHKLTVAVTGPTGTFGFGLIPLLQADARIGRIVGIARRPFDPAEHGWAKMEYRRGDVRESAVLEEAFGDADVVVHLAFMITGKASRQTIRAINVDGTMNAFRAAAAAGAKRFVYASSVAAYGFHPDNPVGMTEEWPVRPAARLFYAQEKAEIESLLHTEAAAHPELELYLLRPPIVVGPHTVGGKEVAPAPVAAVGGRLLDLARRLPVPCRRSLRTCAFSSSTSRTSAGPSCSASSAPARRARTTSPETAWSRAPRWCGSSVSRPCRCRGAWCTPPPGSRPRSRRRLSHRGPRSGSRRPAIQRSWT